jgi:transposase-like protein
MDIAKRLYEGEWANSHIASEELGISNSQLYKWKAEYRRKHGMEAKGHNQHSTKPIGDAEDTRRIGDADSSAQAVVLHKSNPVATNATNARDIEQFVKRIGELEHELHDAHRRIDVLQNLLMVVGGTLV